MRAPSSSSSIRCARALYLFCTRALSTKPYSPAFPLSASLSLSDEEESHSRSTFKGPCPQISEENHNRRLIRAPRSLPQNVLAQQNDLFYWPPPSSPSSSFALSDDEDNLRKTRVLRPLPVTNTVSVFWDLDNKPPHSVPPYEAAIRLREVACSFGRLVDMVAYANRHAFSYLPSYVREERRSRKELDRLEACGLVVPGEPYVCGYCGRRCKTNIALKKHFKQLHERERNKRLNRLDSLKGKKKIKYKQSLFEKETRYKEAARDIITPKVGYGLMQELKRAGVWVRMVSDRPQAADEALMDHISQSIHTGIKCICLVSDDSDFLPVLHEARAQHLHTVVVGDRPRLKALADVQFSWSDLSSGRAFDMATELASIWYAKGGTDINRLKADRLLERAETAVGSEYFRPRCKDFQEWEVSDHSDVETADGSDVDSAVEGSSESWVIEDDDVDDL